MKKRMRLVVITGFVLAGVLLYAVSPLTASADVGIPQPVPTAGAVTPTPMPDGVTGGGGGVSNTVAIQAIITGSTSSTTGLGIPGQVTSLDNTTNTGNGGVPAGVHVVVFDSAGIPMPVASQAASAILNTGDPIWCPKGAAPTAGAGGCTPSFANLSLLLAYLSGTQPTLDGTIWIVNGTDLSGPFVLDGNVLATWKLHALTLQGGWDGTSTGTIVGVTSFSNDLTIKNWRNDISLNDLLFDGAKVSVDTTGNITVHDMEVRNSTSYGLLLTNVAGLTTNVKVTDSSFHNNASTGLEINSNSLVTLSHVTANNNGALGARIITNGAVSIDQGVFSKNGADGLNVSSGGNVGLSYVTADQNNTTGFSHAGAWITTTNGNINLDHGEFNNNAFDGLQAIASGSINASNVSAQNNGTSGFTFAGGYFSAGPNGNVNIDVGSFSHNQYDGLLVNAGGSISLSQVDASYNETSGHTNAGAYLTTTSGSVSISSATFLHNAWNGLMVNSGKNIVAGGVEANNNGNTGAILDAPNGWLSLASSDFNSNLNGGLKASTGGSMDLSRVGASNNNGSVTAPGADLTAGGDITIDLGSTFNDNFFDGLIAASNGSISLDNVTANNNSSSGSVGAATSLTSGVLGDISISNSVFSNNFRDGLSAAAGGNISVDSITANGNDIAGISKLGTNLSANGNISIGNSFFNSNHYDGLHAVSNGNVTVVQTEALFNNFYGYQTAAEVLVANGDINLAGNTVNYNYYDGLNATSGGSMTLANVRVDSNESKGINLAAAHLVAGGGITINQASFSNNAGTGLEADSGGVISMRHVTADNNGGNGISVTAMPDANIICSSAQNNGGYGVSAGLTGTLTLGLYFDGNVSGKYNLTGGGTEVNSTDCLPREQNYKTPTPRPTYLPGPTPAATQAAALTLNAVTVSDGQVVTLDCGSFLGTTLVLPSRDQVVFLCPVTGQASLKHLDSSSLPSALDTGRTLISGMDVEVTQSGQTAGTLNGPVKVDFVIPSNQQGSPNLAILHWDGSKWNDMGGTPTQDGFLESISNVTGVYVLVSK